VTKNLWDLSVESILEEGTVGDGSLDGDDSEFLPEPSSRGSSPLVSSSAKASKKVGGKKVRFKIKRKRSGSKPLFDDFDTFEGPDEEELKKFDVSDKVRLIEQFLLLKEEMVEYLVGKGYLNVDDIYGRLPVEVPLTEYIKLTYLPKIDDPYAKYLIDKCIKLHWKIVKNFENFLKYKAEKLYAQHPDLQSPDDIQTALTDAFRQGLDRSEPGYGNGSLVNFSYLRRWINQKIGRYLKKWKYSNQTVSFGDIEENFDSERPAHFEEVYNLEDFDSHALISDSASSLPEESVENNDYVSKIFSCIKQHVLEEDLELLEKLNEILEDGKANLNAKQKMRLRFYLYGMGIFGIKGKFL